MKNKHLLLAAVLLPALLSGCGLEIVQDWQNSQGEAMPGAGAIAGKDYITGLEPSTDARDYFNQIADLQPIETVSRANGKGSKTSVRFINDGGILIPPGVTISFENRGYCLDPNLPAPKAGDEYQFVPMTKLIPTELQGTYKRLIAQESAGSSDVKANMQRLVWAMRTAGTDSALANSLTSQQKQILDRCSDYAGQFESFNESAKSSNKLRKELNKLADSLVTIRLGDVTYSASDLLNPEAGLQKISDHVDHLIELGDALPVENTGFNYGELEPGIYTDIQGSGSLQYHARIANSTDQPFIFYPSDYIGQVGSPANSSGLFASADTSMRQRVTGGLPDSIGVLHDGIDRSNREDNSSVTFSAEDVDNKRLYEKHNDAKSAEKALKKLFEKKLKQSKREDKEYVGVIFYDSVENKYYVSKNLQKGGTFEASINLRVNDRYQPYAYGHTHGDATIEYPDGHTERFNQRIYDSGGYSGAKLHDGESFSQGDKQLVNSGDYKKGFLLTPSNEWREYP